MLTDLFATAPLSPEQRQAIQAADAEMKRLQSKVAALEAEVGSGQSILTRPEFNREVARMLAFDERYGGVSSVLYFDIASLDTIAVQNGPAIAGAAARQISQILTKHVRSSDIVGRLAPDEFGVLLVRCDNNNAWKKGRDLAALLQHALDSVDGQKLQITVGFGAYTFREEEDVTTGIREAAQTVTKATKP